MVVADGGIRGNKGDVLLAEGGHLFLRHEAFTPDLESVSPNQSIPPHLKAQGEMGGRDPAAAYRRFVEAGLKDPPVNPFRSAAHGWLLGSDQFVDTLRKQIRDPRNADEVPAAKRLRGLELAAVLKAVAGHYHVSADQLGEAHRGDMTHATAAWFTRRYTSATRREISTALGLSHPDSAGNRVRRIERQRVARARLRKDLAAIEKQLAQNRA